MSTSTEGSEAVVARARKVTRLVDAYVKADMDGNFYYSYRETAEDRAWRLEREVRDFHEHVRDHRSLDHIRLEVERVVEEQCSSCASAWETYTEDDGLTYCATCGVLTAEG